MSLALQRITTSTLPSADRKILATYGTWSVERRCRAGYEHTGRFSVAASRAAQRRLTSAAHLLTWLRIEGIDLESATQGDLDRWSEQAGSDRIAVAGFLSWCAKRRITHKLRAGGAPRREPDLQLSDAHRRDLLNRCLHDPELPDDLRAAGALFLLYGLQLSRIVELKREHLHEEQADAGYVRDDAQQWISMHPDGIRVPVPTPWRRSCADYR